MVDSFRIAVLKIVNDFFGLMPTEMAVKMEGIDLRPEEKKAHKRIMDYAEGLMNKLIRERGLNRKALMTNKNPEEHNTTKNTMSMM